MATIRKRGKRWQAQVRMGGTQASASFDTKYEATQWAARKEAEAKAGPSGKVASGGVTVADLVDTYKARSRKAWGASKEASLLRLRDRLGHVRVSQIGQHHVQEFAAQRAAEGAGPKTVNDDVTYLGVVLKFGRAVLRYDIPRGVVEDAQEALKFEGITKSGSRRRTRRVKDSEIDAIKANWRSEIRADILDFALLTAMRMGEILRLDPADIDHEARTVVVRDRKHPTDKIGNDQTVPLLGDAYEILCRGPFRYRRHSVSQAFARAAKRAGLADIRFHDLRHEALSRLAAQGWTPVQLMALSGHKSLTNLSIYAHPDAEDLHRLQERQM